MNGYSYSDIQNMQQKAMERVREMKRTADEVTKSAQEEFNRGKREQEPKRTETVSARVTNMPPNFPENMSYPTFKEFFQREQESSHEQEKPPERENNTNHGILQGLFAEPDKALLLGLIMLLKSEGADEALIMALTYILS